MATSITFTFNNARDIHHAISQLQALEQCVPQDVTITETSTPCDAVQADADMPRPVRQLNNAELLAEFVGSNYEFRSAGGLYDDLSRFYNSKEDLSRHLEGLVSDGALRTARRSRDGARLYTLA